MSESMLEEIVEIMIFKIYWKTEYIDDEIKELLTHFATETCQRVMNYCNLNSIPEGLYETVAGIAVDLLKSEGIDLDELGVQMALDSIRLGDAKFDFSSASSVSEGIYDGIVRNYFADLHRYRKCAL